MLRALKQGGPLTGTLTPRFLSPEWVQEARRLLAGSKAFKSAVQGQTASLLAVVTDNPRGHTSYVYYEFLDGTVAKAEAWEGGGFHGRHAQFTITASYDVFARLQRGDLSLQAAYFQRLVRISGDMKRAMRFAPAFVRYSEIVRGIPTEFA